MFRVPTKGGTSFNRSAPTAELSFQFQAFRNENSCLVEDKNGGIGSAVGMEQGYE